ncbi:MAG TPA: DUF433 domain-containing protein [Chloroflexota bacterium]|nr:DUF433 domain-containing protein [Chloroflexota bacterium]
MASELAGQAGEVYPGVVVDPRIMYGLPVLAGTRIPVQFIVGQLAAGESIEAVMQAYSLTQEQVRTALGNAAERVAAETVYVVSDR